MKDYTLSNEKQKESFIVNFQVENENIIINYADNTREVIPYNKESKECLLRVLEKQLGFGKNALDIIDSKLKDLKNDISLIIKLLIVFLFLILLLGQFSYLYYILGGISTLISIIPPIITGINLELTKKEITEDLKKHELFLATAENLNNYGNNSQVLLNVTKKTAAKIKTMEQTNDDIFDINSIHNMTFKELLTLCENIEQILQMEQELGIEIFEKVSQDNNKTLKPNKR